MGIISNSPFEVNSLSACVNVLSWPSAFDDLRQNNPKDCLKRTKGINGDCIVIEQRKRSRCGRS